MAEKKWETMKTQFCDHVGCEVTLEVEMLYPAEFLPDQPAQVLSKRCSRGLECNQLDTMSCVWAGTNPLFDPFVQ